MLLSSRPWPQLATWVIGPREHSSVARAFTRLSHCWVRFRLGPACEPPLTPPLRRTAPQESPLPLVCAFYAHVHSPTRAVPKSSEFCRNGRSAHSSFQHVVLRCIIGIGATVATRCTPMARSAQRLLSLTALETAGGRTRRHPRAARRVHQTADRPAPTRHTYPRTHKHARARACGDVRHGLTAWRASSPIKRTEKTRQRPTAAAAAQRWVSPFSHGADAALEWRA